MQNVQKDPTYGEQLKMRSEHLTQTADEIQASVNDTITAINIVYGGKMVVLKPTTPEHAKLYDDALQGIVNGLRAEAEDIGDAATLELGKEQRIFEEQERERMKLQEEKMNSEAELQRIEIQRLQGENNQLAQKLTEMQSIDNGPEVKQIDNGKTN